MKKILVVDDDPHMLDSVASILTQERYQIQVIWEWEMAYRKVREFQPDLIILDAYLNGMDGRIICRNLKNNSDTKHIPVIVISAYATAANAVNEYGADVFMAKPFVMDKLLHVVKRYISRDTE